MLIEIIGIIASIPSDVRAAITFAVQVVLIRVRNA